MSKVEQFDEDQKRDMRKLFQTKDKDKSGCLDAEELEECLFLMGMCPTSEDIEFFSKTFDKNGDGKLQISELVENIHVLHAHSLKGEDMMEAFKVFDVNGNGSIRYTELFKILCHNDFMATEDARKLMSTLSEKYDHNGDGKFSYAEFVEIFLSDSFQEAVMSKMD